MTTLGTGVYNEPMKLIAIGEKKIEAQEQAIVLCRSALMSMKPRLVMSDFDNGWGLIVAQEAIKMGIPVMGVLPHAEVLGNAAYRYERKEALRNSSTKVVFEEDYLAFLRNPKPYVNWVLKSANAALCYVDEGRSSISHSLMISFRQVGKQTHNLYRSHT